jgi:hypothetical protein
MAALGLRRHGCLIAIPALVRFVFGTFSSPQPRSFCIAGVECQKAADSLSQNALRADCAVCRSLFGEPDEVCA